MPTITEDQREADWPPPDFSQLLDHHLSTVPQTGIYDEVAGLTADLDLLAQPDFPPTQPDATR